MAKQLPSFVSDIKAIVSVWHQATGAAHARLPLLSFLSLPLIPISPRLLALPGTAMKGCGMIRGTKGTGVELHPEKGDPGVVQVDLNKALRLGTHMTSSRHGETSLTSPRGARGSPHFLHACRYVTDLALQRCILYVHLHWFHCILYVLLPVYLIGYNVSVCFYSGLPISEGLSLPTSNHLLLTSLLHHRTILDASHLVLCRTTFLPDTTMTGHHTPHIALTTLREILLEVWNDSVVNLNWNPPIFWLFVPFNSLYYLSTIFPVVMQTCQVLLLLTTIPIRGSLPQVWVVTTLPGVEASTQILARPHTASMAIHPTSVTVSIQSRTILVWCRMYPTLTFQLGSWLHWSKLVTCFWF